jgi:hypothetical protein
MKKREWGDIDFFLKGLRTDLQTGRKVRAEEFKRRLAKLGIESVVHPSFRVDTIDDVHLESLMAQSFRDESDGETGDQESGVDDGMDLKFKPVRELTEGDLLLLFERRPAMTADFSVYPKPTPMGHRPRTRIERPPGHNIARFAEFVFSKKANEEIFRQMIADMRIEHCEALKEGRAWKAWFGKLRDQICILEAVITYLLSGTVKRIVKVIKFS